MLQMDRAQLRRSVVLHCPWSPTLRFMFRLDEPPLCSALTLAAQNLPSQVRGRVAWLAPGESKWDWWTLSQEASSPGGSIFWSFGSKWHFRTSTAVFQMFFPVMEKKLVAEKCSP